MVFVSALICNLKFHYVCSYFKSLKSFRGSDVGDGNKCKMNKKKTKIEIPFEPGIRLLGIYLKKKNNHPKEETIGNPPTLLVGT